MTQNRSGWICMGEDPCPIERGELIRCGNFTGECEYADRTIRTESVPVLKSHKKALQKAILQVAEQRDGVYADLEATSLLLGHLARAMEDPVAKENVEIAVSLLKEQYQFRTLEEFVGGEE